MPRIGAILYMVQDLHYSPSKLEQWVGRVAPGHLVDWDIA